MRQSTYAIANIDTQVDALCFLSACLRRTAQHLVLVDLSTKGASDRADVTARTVAEAHPDGPDAVLGQTDRGQAVTAMAEALQNWLSSQAASGKVAGVIALGGSGGTAIVSPALQTLPIGMPRSEEHTSELQSRRNIVCRLPLEKKKERTKQNARRVPISDQPTD